EHLIAGSAEHHHGGGAERLGVTDFLDCGRYVVQIRNCGPLDALMFAEAVSQESVVRGAKGIHQSDIRGSRISKKERGIDYLYSDLFFVHQAETLFNITQLHAGDGIDFFLGVRRGLAIETRRCSQIVAPFSQAPRKELFFEHPVNHPVYVDDFGSLRTIVGIKVVVSKSCWTFLEMAISID